MSPAQVDADVCALLYPTDTLCSSVTLRWFDRQQRQVERPVWDEGVWKGMQYTQHMPVPLSSSEAIAQHTTKPGAGALLNSLDPLQSGYFVVRPKEQWIWPAQMIGERVSLPRVVPPNPPKEGPGSLSTSSDKGQTPPDKEQTVSLVLETMSVRPRIFKIEDFLSDHEANVLRELAENQLQPSKLYEKGELVVSPARNSKQGWLYVGQNKTSDAVSERVRQLVGQGNTPAEIALAEAIQVVRYQPGEHYHSHYDYLPAGQLASDGQGQYEQRLLTVFLYLGDVEEGGQTCFPYVGPTGYVYAGGLGVDWKDCSRGLIVTPRKGMALLWYNLLAENHLAGDPDVLTLHAGCDVVRGTKYAANVWIHNVLLRPIP